MNVLEQERLNRILNARPAYRKGIDKAQIDSVRKVLEDGGYIDFNWALQYCNKTQRLGAVIYILRHEEGMKIVEWQPTTYGGSVYSLYEYAPEEIRYLWEFIKNMTPEEIKFFDFTKRKAFMNLQKGVIAGQISMFELL